MGHSFSSGLWSSQRQEVTVLLYCVIIIDFLYDDCSLTWIQTTTELVYPPPWTSWRNQHYHWSMRNQSNWHCTFFPALCFARVTLFNFFRKLSKIIWTYNYVDQFLDYFFTDTTPILNSFFPMKKLWDAQRVNSIICFFKFFF